jgi:hypothetical protein
VKSSDSGTSHMYCVDSCDVGPSLQYVPEADGHGFLEPVTEMSFEEYQGYLFATQASWEEIVP